MLPKTLRKLYLYKTGGKDIQVDYLTSTSKTEYPDIYLDSNDYKIIKNKVINLPRLKSGKIAFIKDSNIWLTEGDGTAYALTPDGGKKQLELFTAIPEYRYPIWSPGGKNLAFIQLVHMGGTSISRPLITNGNLLHIESFPISEDLHPYWLNDDEMVIPGTTSFISEKIVFEGDHSSQQFNFPGRPFFGGGFNTAQECDGGGGRASFFYLEGINKMVYSSGCQQEVSLLKSSNSKNSEWFDNNKKPYDIIKSLKKIPGQDIPFLFRVFPENVDSYYGPKELTLSHNKNLILGIENGNVVIYDSSPKFVKTLWNSGKAYGPVFSQDDKFIYFIDNSGSEPELVKLDLETGENKIIFKSDAFGSISNISPSPDDSQIVFTLIKETEDVYLVNNDGSGLTLFIKNAGQAAWSSK